MSTSIKLLLAIVATLLIAVGFYACDWSEKLQRRQAAQANLLARRDQWQRLKAAIQEYPSLQQQVLERQRLFGVNSERGDDFVANYLGEVERRVAGSGDPSFRIQSISAAAATLQAPFQTRVFSLSLKGRYSTLVDFLWQLSARKADRVVTINSLRLSQGEGGRLTVDLPLTAYMKSATP